MKAYLQKKTAGFYLTVLATILAIIGLINYASDARATSIVFTLVGIAIAVEVLLLVVSKVAGNKPIFDVAASACAILMAAALTISFSTQLDAIGYVVSGLYTSDMIMKFAYFVIFAAISMLLYLIASFTSLGKQ